MALRSRDRPRSRIPEVNLVPMMDVLMTVLIFFVVIAMNLTGVQIAGVTLPRSVEGTEEELINQADIEPLVVGLTAQGELILAGESITLDQLSREIRTYFAANPEGNLMLKADRTLPYKQVADLLTDLRSLGGNRVTLAVE
ncbi:biopolymer transporter ExbD [Romeria aff. gracilis LEGE 07310]|uniref:Biopolymer transporter ExbD n=1 Tax=Vasconcelosia minhoensis LEGE 07310 TaxID=915328 RepID=A0A8J7A6R4_9CYAN|nr:biopolymer transporter ExbD [Romeria gracilis]MBE9077035.1 biopolymer transporter ExbD [Romeria aff. gracilis LEGE 07310]